MFGLQNELSTFSHMTVHRPLEASSVWLKTTHFQHRPLWTVHYRSVYSGQNFYLWFWADWSRILWCLSHWEFEIAIRIIVDINGDRIGRFSRWRSYVTYWWCLFFLFDLHNLRKIHLVWIWWSFIRWGWRLKIIQLCTIFIDSGSFKLYQRLNQGSSERRLPAVLDLWVLVCLVSKHQG